MRMLRNQKILPRTKLSIKVEYKMSKVNVTKAVTCRMKHLMIEVE